MIYIHSVIDDIFYYLFGSKDGKEVKDVFGSPDVSFRVGLSCKTLRPAHDMDARQQVLRILDKYKNISRHYITEISVKDTLNY